MARSIYKWKNYKWFSWTASMVAWFVRFFLHSLLSQCALFVAIFIMSYVISINWLLHEPTITWHKEKRIIWEQQQEDLNTCICMLCACVSSMNPAVHFGREKEREKNPLKNPSSRENHWAQSKQINISYFHHNGHESSGNTQQQFDSTLLPSPSPLLYRSHCHCHHIFITFSYCQV